MANRHLEKISIFRHHASRLVSDVRWLEENGWNAWSEEDVDQASRFVSDVRWLEENGEVFSEERAKDVAEHVANLEALDE